jgi:hypothetical protein
MKSLTRTELLGYSLLLFVYALGIYFANSDVVFFDTHIAQEDGFAEYGTAFMLLCISILTGGRLLNLGSRKPLLWKIGLAGMTLVFLFGAGEEISWGQRLFGIESSEYFLENNAQQETNLHNMMVGETKINKLVFSQILTVVLVIYLLILPILYRKKEWAKNLVNSFGVPVARWSHTTALVLATGMLEFMKSSSRRWELYELAFGVIFFIIFLNPLNDSIYKKES